jgi:two-component system, OmpR family, response regulator
MKTQELNLFIVDDDKSTAYSLKHYLNDKFGDKLNISTFFDGESCLENIDSETDVVILDYFLNDKNGNEILSSIKKRNPRTEVIMLSGNENLETAIESFKLGAKNYVVKGRNALKKIAKLIRSIMDESVNSLNEFGVTKFVSVFLVTFLTMAATVSLVLELIT